MRLQESNESSDLINFWICGDPLPEPRSRCACKAGHEWVVYSTALEEGWLMLQCVGCGLMGTIENPSERSGLGRSTPRRDHSLVGRRQGGSPASRTFSCDPSTRQSVCPCPREATLPETTAMSEFPVDLGAQRVLTDDVRAELLGAC